MTYNEIRGYDAINVTESEKVAELVQSMLANGWQGMPILVNEPLGQLITGSHRLAALKEIENYIDSDDEAINEIAYALIYKTDIAEDVSEIINDYCAETGDDIIYDNLRPVFEGTWVEKHKDEIVEW